MKTSALALGILQFVEEFREKAYQDSGGVWTIGFGHTGGEVKEGMSCSLEQAQAWLKDDVGKAEEAIRRLVRTNIVQCEFDALVIFVYNVGVRAFSTSHLLEQINLRNFVEAAAQFMRWTLVKGVENAGLKRRRALEQALFISTNYMM